MSNLSGGSKDRLFLVSSGRGRGERGTELYMKSHASLTEPCNHQPIERVRRGKEGERKHLLFTLEEGGGVDEGEEEEEGARLFSSLSKSINCRVFWW